MPKLSDRQRFLREIHSVLAVAALEEADSDTLGISTADTEVHDEKFLFSEVDAVSDVLLLVQSSRYLVARERLPKATVFLADTFFTQPRIPSSE